MTARIDTMDGCVPIDFDDLGPDTDAESVAVEAPPLDLSPAMLRLLTKTEADAIERAAQRLEGLAGGVDILIPTSRAAAIVRGGA